MGDHFRDGAAMIRQPLCVYGADERLVAYNQAFANLHLLPDSSCLLYPGITFQEIMEWRRQVGFSPTDRRMMTTRRTNTSFASAM
jgi:hypothetical protein